MSTAIKDKGLNISAILVGMSLPLLVFGKAWIGIALGLALLISLVCGSHKTAISRLRSFLTPKIIIVLVILVFASSVNILFSIRTGLSFEAWIRTWLMLGAIIYLFLLIEEKLSLIVKSLIISLLITNIYLITLYIYYNINDIYKLFVNKFYFNCIILTFPIILILRNTNLNNKYKIIHLINISVLLILIILISGKAALAGVLLMALISIILIGLIYLSLTKIFISSAFFLFITGIFLVIWLPEQQNNSSLFNSAEMLFPFWLVDMHRQLIWTFSYELFLENPLFGIGLNASNYHEKAQILVNDYFAPRFGVLNYFDNLNVLPAHPHNWALEMMLDGGLILFIPLSIAVIWILMQSIFNFYKTKNILIVPFVLVHSAFWGTGLLNFSFWSTHWQASYFVMIILTFLISKQHIGDNKNKN